MAVIRNGPFGEPLYPNSRPDLSMETMMRYRTIDTVEDVARFYRDHYEPAGKTIQTSMGTDDSGEPVFTLSVGRLYKEPVHFSAIVVMEAPKLRKKQASYRHILVISK